MNSEKRLVSVCVPAYNESACVDELARRLGAVFDALADRYDFEAIICENGSVDDTYEKLIRIHRRDPRFKIVQLSRNFNTDGGVTAALSFARGDAAVIMNADLQDPPEIIPAFIEKWELGYENVYGVIAQRAGESRFRRFCAEKFYYLFNRVSESPAPRNVSDFRLVDRVAYQTYLRMPERYRLMRAMWGWMGFRSIGVEHERAPRFAGASSFQFFPSVVAAVRAILQSSRTPLTVIPAMGMILAGVSFALLIGETIRAFFYGVPFDGFGTIVTLMLLLFGFLFLFLGMIAEYIGMIFFEIRARPNYIVRAVHGLEGIEPRSNAVPPVPGVDVVALR